MGATSRTPQTRCHNPANRNMPLPAAAMSTEGVAQPVRCPECANNLVLGRGELRCLHICLHRLCSGSTQAGGEPERSLHRPGSKQLLA